MRSSFRTIRNLSLLLLVLILLISGIFSYSSSIRIIQLATLTLEKKQPLYEKLGSIKLDFIDAEEGFFTFLRSGEGSLELVSVHLDHILRKSQEINTLVDQRHKPYINKFITSVRRFKTTLHLYDKEFKIDPAASSINDIEDTVILVVDESRKALEVMIRDIEYSIKSAQLNMSIEAKKNISRVILVTALGVMAGLLISILMSFGLRRLIVNLVKGTKKIAEGDLHFRFKITSRDEIGQLSIALNRMAEELNFSMQKEKMLRMVVEAAVEREKDKAEDLSREVVQRKRTEEELKTALSQVKVAHEQLIQLEKLEAVGRIASGVAHEVKNPLGVILQSVNFLESKLPFDQKDTAEVFQLVKHNIQRADKIIRGLVDYSRASELSLQPEEINPILESSYTLVKHMIRLESIEIVREETSGLPLVLVDRGKIEQVFVNIFLNAIQSMMPRGGKLTIHSSLAIFDKPGNGVGRRNADRFKLDEKVVLVEIEDTGTGIPPEQISKVFDPFFTTKEPGSGTGLGLSVTKNIIDLHKAVINIESQVGKGTKVKVLLKTI